MHFWKCHQVNQVLMERISNDVWFHTFHLLTPLDFLGLSHTCSFCYNLCSSKYTAIDKYWECKCKHLWSKINETNYKAKNWNKLFESMAHFIESAVTGMNDWQYQEITALSSLHCRDLNNYNICRCNLKEKVKKLAYNMTVTVDTISNGINISDILELTIIHDHLEMFKIYTCNMSDDILNKPFHSKTFKSRADGYLILHDVIRKGAVKICKYLLGSTNDEAGNKTFKDIDVLVVDEHYYDKNTPLTVAAWKKHAQIVELLINHPNMTTMGMNKTNTDGMRPLHYACGLSSQIDINDQMETIRLLIDDERTNVNSRGPNGITPLMVAIRQHPKFVELLLQHDNINVNMQNNQGNTALHLVYVMRPTKYSDKERAENCIKSAKLLMVRDDLDCGIINDLGKTAVQMVQETKWKQMERVLNGTTLQK